MTVILEPGDNIALIVEDDAHYARIMLAAAKEQGFKVLVAQRGADALELAREHLRRRFRWTFSCRTCSAGRC